MTPSIRDPAYFHALVYFERVAHHLSFAKAAEELGVTPSAVSHRIAALERTIGKPVFYRSNRTIRLSQEGAELAGTLGPALSAIREVGQAITERTVLRVFHNLVGVAARPAYRRRAGAAALRLDRERDRTDLVVGQGRRR